MWPFNSSLNRKVAQMALDITALQAAVSKLTTVQAGVEKLLATLSQEIKDLAAQLDPATQAALQKQLNDLAGTVDASATQLAADVVANTPSA